MQQVEERNNKRWRPEEISFLQKNIDKPIPELASSLNRSEGSVTTMVWKIKEGKYPISNTISSIKSEWDSGKAKPVKELLRTDDKPQWKIQFDKALITLVKNHGMSEEQARRELGYALSSFSEKPELKNLPVESIYNTLLDIGRTKVSLNPAQKLAFIVERDGKCVFEISYRGLCKILIDSGSVKIIDAFIVYEGEEFDYNPAENILTHKPKFGFSEEENNKRKIIGAYSRAILADGMKHFHFIELYKLEKIERMSNASFYGEWRMDMYKKTAIRSHYKFLPKKDLSEHIHNAILLDEQSMAMNFDKSKKKGKSMMDFFSNNDEII